MTAQPFLNRVPLLIVAVKLLKYVGNNVFQDNFSRCYFYSFIHFLYLIYQSENVKKKWTKRIWRRSQSSYAKRSISSFFCSTLNLHLLRKTPCVKSSAKTAWFKILSYSSWLVSKVKYECKYVLLRQDECRREQPTVPEESETRGEF